MVFQYLWPYPKVIAHRGGGVLAPENTLYAIEIGTKYGYKAVEFDVMLSKDNIPMIMHDEILSRTVGNTPFKGYNLCDLNATELCQIDAGSWFDSSLTSIKIPTFEEIIQYCILHDIWMNIEIKPAKGYEVETGRIVAEITNKYFPPMDQTPSSSTNSIFSSRSVPLRYPLFSSFSFTALLEAKKYAPHIDRGYLIKSVDIVPTWKDDMLSLEAIAVHTDHNRLTEEVAREIKELGYGLFCYTVNSQETAEKLLSWGMDSYCTDRLDLFRQG